MSSLYESNISMENGNGKNRHSIYGYVKFPLGAEELEYMQYF